MKLTLRCPAFTSGRMGVVAGSVVSTVVGAVGDKTVVGAVGDKDGH